ncbi:MAG: ABC transporter permease [Proteobacteria bacterium]|nr:ABC transporter permease [Pseudomonadota bacterium]
MNTLRFLADNWPRALYLTWEHVWMVGLALALAALIGVPLGVLISRRESLAAKVLNTANILMTIPSVALFGLMLPILSWVDLGLGKVPAVIALVLYSQLPIIRNTCTAIRDVPPSVIEAGRGMGMDRSAMLLEVEIPLAIPVILAGLRTAAVMNIGIASIAAYIGAGGLGVFIQQDIDRVYPEMILAGAALVSILAIFVDSGMALLERLLTPRGLNIQQRMTQ